MFNASVKKQHPLHPFCLELMVRSPKTKDEIHVSWMSESKSIFKFESNKNLSEQVLIASPELKKKINERIDDLCQKLKSKLLSTSLPTSIWSNAPDADVLTVDYAIIQDQDTTLSWDLRLVEFQAFTSLLTTGYLLHQVHQKLWPELANFQPWGSHYEGKPVQGTTHWKEICGQWQAGSESTVLLEHNPYQRPTSFDLMATSQLWNIPLIDPQQLKFNGTQLLAKLSTGETIPIKKIFNRLILSDIEKDLVSVKNIRDTDVKWHSHPAWYYGIHKGTATEVNFKFEPKNARANEWKSLNMPASSLVAKNIFSFGGKDLLISPNEAQLNSLQNANDWLIQPKYTAFPIFYDEDGTATFGEIRLIVNLKNIDQPWIAMQMIRLYRGHSAASSYLQGKRFEGITLLYNPPQSH
jgi:hypothetical protein